MAFNPFHRFRKHQKVFMALLAVMTMIIFVFQFGRGDAFTRMLNFFAGFGGKGQVVNTLDGNKVSEGELDRLRAHRRVANDFVLGLPDRGLYSYTHDAVEQIVELDRKTKEGSETKPPLPFTLKDLAARVARRNIRQINYQAAMGELMEVRKTLGTMPDVGKNPVQARNIQALTSALALEAWLSAPERQADRTASIFGGSITRPEDALDFLLWKHQADKLGITLTETDVGREIGRLAGYPELFGDDGFDRSKIVAAFLRDRRSAASMRPSDLLEAIRDELRVELAKEALMGDGDGIYFYRSQAEPVRMSPAAATPDEFLDYFREQRTTLKVAFLPVPVGNFVEKVQGQPNDEELLHTFDAYKDDEPRPNSRVPGFKQPRRIKVQFAHADADGAYFKKAAAERARLLSRLYSSFDTPEAIVRLRSLATASPLGGPAAWALRVAALSGDDPFVSAYEAYRKTEEDNIARDLSIAIDLRDRSAVKDRPAVYVATIGQVLGMAQSGQGMPMGPAAALAAGSVLPGLQAQVERTTVRAFASEVLAAATGSPFSALLTPVPLVNAPLPKDSARPQVLVRLEETLAGQLAWDSVQRFQKELRALKNKPAEAQKFIDKSVAEYGLEGLTSMREARSTYELADDMTLKPLKTAYDKAQDNQMIQSLVRFFAPREPKLGLLELPFNRYLFEIPPGTYQPEDVPPLGDLAAGFGIRDFWIWWRTEDKSARPRTFDEVRAEVESSWRFDKARVLARNEAEAIQKAIEQEHKGLDAALRALRDAGARLKPATQEFDLSNIAHLVPRSNLFMPGRDLPVELRPYEVPSDKEQYLKYPPADFVTRLLTLKEPGDALVMADRPAKNYYVAVLEARSVPSMREFVELYGKPRQNDQVYNQLMNDQRRELYLDLMKQLRKDAGAKLDEQGNYIIPESIRGRGDSGQGDPM